MRLVIVVLLFVGVTNINGQSKSSKASRNSPIKGRLLTPEEGCGLTKVRNNKIVGGSYAKSGK